jgi:copper chaperone CopZ
MQTSSSSSEGDNSARGRGQRESGDARETLRDSLLLTPVEGMHSHRCSDTIIRAVMALSGVREAEVDFPARLVSVLFDPRKVSGRQVIAAIEQAGYRCPEYSAGDVETDKNGPGDRVE